jgi:hypothetical protein
MRSALPLLLALLVAGCAAPRPDADLPEVETRDDLLDGLRALGNYVVPLDPALFQLDPAPAAAYEVTDTDGRAYPLVAYAPEDYDLLRQNSARANLRPDVGLVGTARDRYRPVLGQVRAQQPALFRKGEVVVVFPVVQADLYYDLELLLGRPTY